MSIPKYMSMPEQATEYGCEAEWLEEMERRNNPTPEQIEAWKKEDEEREKLGIERWIKKKRKEAEERMAKREEELQRQITYWKLKAEKNNKK